MAFLHNEDFSVISCSPELFLRIDGDKILSKPIKGTISRGESVEEDLRRIDQLSASIKDLAELAMIVDLQRNDLGRICAYIQTCWPPTVESFATVHHLVATVVGSSPPGRTAKSSWNPKIQHVGEILRRTFPAGSITGAPKIRAMEIIDDLEPVARGPYCGSIGFVGFDGRAVLSVAIRTLIYQNGHVHMHAGCGIVADSDAHQEFAESLAKKSGMSNVFRWQRQTQVTG